MGDVIGFFVAATGSCASDLSVVGFGYHYKFLNIAAGATDELFGDGVGQLDVSAALEPDADDDGYGDERQDGCPADPSTQGPCQPDTEITKGPKRTITRRKAKFKFRSDQPAATFECNLDRRRFKPCTSPRKYQRLRDGKHRFQARAVNEGVVDPTPAKRKFRVKGGLI